MKLTLATCCLFLSVIALAQRKPILKFSPGALFEMPLFPAIQPGIEFRLSEKIAWYNELGIQYRKGYDRKIDTNFNRSRGYKFKSEIRYYFKTNESRVYPIPIDEVYLAANIFVVRSSYDAEIAYYYQKDSSDQRADVFGVRKTAWGMNLLIGKQKRLGISRFLLDVYAGLGVRIRDVNTTNKEFDKDRDAMIRSRHPNIYDITNATDAGVSDRTAPNFTLGIRICYQL